MNGVTAERVSPQFANLLAAERERYNALFASARHQYGDVDAQAFTRFLRTIVDPLVVATARIDGADPAQVAEAAFEVGLCLLGQNLLGPNAHEHAIENCFSALLVPYAAVVAEAPSTVLAALGNATHHLSNTPGARPEFFSAELLRMAGQVHDAGTLLSLGQIVAWRAGMSQFREGALARLAQVEEGLGRAALALPPGADYGATLARLRRDRWFDPTRAEPTSPRWVGAFRGFGGLFLEPPRVAASDERLWLKSGAEHWLLLADAFGATLHRLSDEEVASGGGFRATTEGDRPSEVTAADATQFRGKLLSLARTEHTWALTFSQSHAVLLVPREAP